MINNYYLFGKKICFICRCLLNFQRTFLSIQSGDFIKKNHFEITDSSNTLFSHVGSKSESCLSLIFNYLNDTTKSLSLA